MAGADAVMMRRHRISVVTAARSHRARRVRPSPFQQVSPEIVVTRDAAATRSSAVGAGAESRSGTASPNPRESRFDRFISRIPLLRHLRKHPPADETESALAASAGCATG